MSELKRVKRRRKDKPVRQEDISTAYDERVEVRLNKRGEEVEIYTRTPLPLSGRPPPAPPIPAAEGSSIHHEYLSAEVDITDHSVMEVPVKKSKVK
jgi:hypothetical protein